MIREEKDLLLKDLCARLPYGVKIELTWWVMGEGMYINTTLEPDHIEQLLNDEDGDTEIKPYLRPMSSMSGEEIKKYKSLNDALDENYEVHIDNAYPAFDWLNEHHFDYRGLIDKGLAIEVTEENNPYLARK